MQVGFCIRRKDFCQDVFLCLKTGDIRAGEDRTEKRGNVNFPKEEGEAECHERNQ